MASTALELVILKAVRRQAGRATRSLSVSSTLPCLLYQFPTPASCLGCVPALTSFCAGPWKHSKINPVFDELLWIMAFIPSKRNTNPDRSWTWVWLNLIQCMGRDAVSNYECIFLPFQLLAAACFPGPKPLSCSFSQPAMANLHDSAQRFLLASSPSDPPRYSRILFLYWSQLTNSLRDTDLSLSLHVVELNISLSLRYRY